MSPGDEDIKSLIMDTQVDPRRHRLLGPNKPGAGPVSPCGDPERNTRNSRDRLNVQAAQSIGEKADRGSLICSYLCIEGGNESLHHLSSTPSKTRVVTLGDVSRETCLCMLHLASVLSKNGKNVPPASRESCSQSRTLTCSKIGALPGRHDLLKGYSRVCGIGGP